MRISALDIMRFVAAFAVVIYHYFASNAAQVSLAVKHVAQFGYLGVPLFFIISGYVIAMSADSRNAIQFAWARFLRLYPIYWLGVFYTVLVVLLLDQTSISFQYLAFNLTMLNGYLNVPNVDGVYWTLHAELKFYGCIFLLLATGLYRFIHLWLSLWMLAAVTYLLVQQPFFMSWFIDPDYSSYFIAGIGFYLIHQEKHFKLAYSVIIVSLIVSLVRGLEQASGFLFRSGTLDLAMVGMLIFLMYFLFYLLVTNRLNVKSNYWIYMAGQLTYPLYLVHNIAGKAIISTLTQFMGYVPAAFFAIVLATGVSLVLVKVAEALIIQPLRRVTS